MSGRWLAPLIVFALGTQVLASPAEADRSQRAQGSAARAAFLDSSFGEGGRSMLAVDSAREVRAALMPDNGLVLGTGSTFRRLGPDGRLDESFGQGGTVTPPAPPGGEIEIEGFAVDPAGRLIVAGTARLPLADPPAEVTFGFGAPEKPRAARVLRYLPNGGLDPEFGTGGVVETALGLPAPRDEDGKQILPEPWVEVTGVAVDSQGRVLLTGGASAGLEFGCMHDWFFDTLTYAAFVARLTPAGGLDSSFGQNGVFGGRHATENPLRAEVSASPTVGARDEVTYGTGYPHCPWGKASSGIGRLSPSGELVAGFGIRGAVRRSSSDPLVQPDGRIAVIGLAKTWYHPKESALIAVERLTANGRPDRSFGTRGKAVLRTPGGANSLLAAAATGGRGRLLLGGTMFTRRPGTPKKPRHSSLILMRLTAGGRPERSFAPRGRAAAGFGSRTLDASQLLVDSQGRALLVGTYGPWEHEGVAVVRYAISR